MTFSSPGRAFLFILLSLVISFFTLAQAGADDTEKAPAGRGKRLYEQYCIPCHGLTGRGDGDRVAREHLDPRPRVHADGSYMNLLPDMRLFRVIKFGGRSMNFSKIMPQWQHILTDADIIDLIAHIRSLADPPYQPGMAVMGGCRLPPPRDKESGS